jgi:two-component system sensor histidine kinase YesM
MPNRFRELFTLRSVRYKLMAASIACILVPAALTSLIYNDLTQDAVKRQAVSNAEESLLLVNGYVTNLLKYMLNIANYVQVNSEMNTYFKMLASGTAYEGSDDSYRRFTDANRITEQLENFVAVGEKCYVTVLLTDGSYFTNYSPYEYNPLNFKKEPWFGRLESLRGFQSFWTGATPTVFTTERWNNPYQISVVRTLRRENSDIYGYVIVTVMENRINQIFNRLAENEEVMILDGSYNILSHRDSSKIGQPFPYLKLLDEERKTSDVFPIGGENYLVTEQQLPFTDWHLVSMQPYKKAIVNINSIFNKVFVFQLGSFFVFLLLLLYLLRAFTKPLVRLGKVAATVQRGNLAVRSGVRGQDEIGRLGYSFDQMLDKVKEMIAEVSETHARKRKAELAMLQAQINPHFLFNVLNSIRMKVMRRGDQESANMIGALSKLLRMTITQEKDEISLHEEIDLITNYMKLMNMRQKEEVELILDVSKEAFLVKVPRFFLQPIIENALIHGLNRCAGTISIQARMEEKMLILTVEDSGIGMDAVAVEALRKKIASGEGNRADEEGPGSHFSGIGLPNVYERMKMTFGEGFRMDVQSERGKGTRIIMFIPLREGTPDV